MAHQATTISLDALRRPLMVIGGLLIAAALLADPLGLSAAGFSRGQALVGLVGGLIFAVGALGGRVVRAYQSLGLLLMNTLVLLVIIEIGAGVVSWLISDDEAETVDVLDTNVRDWRSLPYYADKEWAEAYWAEAAELQTTYAPFVIWRTVPHHGQYINTDADGLRVTPDSVCEADSFTVFAFGGSTMWGAGAPDWGTLPAYLLQGLQARLEKPICMVNFGQAAYVSTQNVIDLSLRLQANDVPDLVIFYSGINEVQAAYESGRGNVHQNLSLINRLFENINPEPPPLGEHIADELRQNTYSVRLFDRWFGERLGEVAADQTVPTYATQGVPADELAAQTLATYFGNYRLVQTLAEGYGFQYFFFWQPVIALTQKPLTPEEAPLRAGLDPSLVELYQAAYDQVAEQSAAYDHFYDLRAVLDKETDQLWIDEFHITPVGNELVARRMLEIMMSALSEPPQSGNQ